MRAPILAFAAAILIAPAVLAQSVGGKYLVRGTNFDGSPYGGTVMITPSSNSTCRIEWQTGDTSSKGFCMVANGALAAAYKLKDSVGLVLYQLQPDGSLKGTWTLADRPGSGTEDLIPAK
jgi:hypothetical protein